jgi:nucleotide-binding universal stress UspA family protein
MTHRLIVHPTDFTLTSDAAFKKALDLARRDGAKLVLVHVIEPPSPLLADHSAAHYTEHLASMQAKARGMLELMLVRAKRVNVPASDVLLKGSPPEEIVRLAKKRGADLIVIGTRGRTGLKELMLGSTAERVIGLAHCSVLTVRRKR